MHAVLKRLLAAFLVAISLSTGQGLVWAARPATVDLLPPDTLIYLRVTDTQALRERFMQTGLGKMSQDEQMRPLVGQLYGTAAEAWLGVRDELDLELGELLEIPRGEIALAIVPVEESRPAAILLVDVGEEPEAARKVVERAKQMLEQGGATKTEKEVAGTKVTILATTGRRQRRLAFAEREGALLFGSEASALELLLKQWAERGAALRQNERFSTIMNSVRATRDETQIAWFVDPIELVRSNARSTAARLGLAILPALGLDGLHGLGGSVALATDDFDVVSHVHVLLDNPRAGVIDLVQMGSGEMTPEPWIPANAASYFTTHVELEKVMTKGERLYDSFQEEGAWQGLIRQRVSEPLGADVAKEILPALTGRITRLTVVEQPATTLRQPASLVALHVKDVEGVNKALDKVAEKHADRLETKRFGNYTYRQFTPRRELPEGVDPRLRLSPCFVLYDGCLVVTDRTSLMESLLSGSLSGESSLAKSLEYKLISNKAERMSGGAKPALIAFERPEEGMRALYQLASDAKNRERLRQAADGNQTLSRLNKALEENPLPPFEVIAQYFAPGGAVLFDDETGFHYIGFTFRRK